MGEIGKLRLYTAGKSFKSVTALQNLERYCKQHLEKYEIEVVDLLLYPHLAEQDQILAVPTLVRISPVPICRVIGDLSDEQKVVMMLG